MHLCHEGPWESVLSNVFLAGVFSFITYHGCFIFSYMTFRNGIEEVCHILERNSIVED